VLPDFIIFDTQKSGITTIGIYIVQHLGMGICMVNKEIYFFNKWNGEEVVGEKILEYLYDKILMERLHKVLPNVKLIFVFRNLVDSTYSHYWYNVRNGQETLSFEKALEKEEERIKIRNENLKENKRRTLKQILGFLRVETNFLFKDLEENMLGVQKVCS